jgi:hypothetical protein
VWFFRLICLSYIFILLNIVLEIITDLFIVLLILKSTYVVHDYNPSYSRGRDQEDYTLRTAWAKTSARAHLNKQSWQK